MTSTSDTYQPPEQMPDGSITPAYRPNPHHVSSAQGDVCPYHHLVQLQNASEAEVTADLRWDGNYGIDERGDKVWDWVHVQLDVDLHEVRFLRLDQSRVVMCIRRTKKAKKRESQRSNAHAQRP